MPAAVGSTSAGATWDWAAHHGLEPAAILFAGSVDSLSAGGLVLAREWEGSPVVVVDELGERFLDSVADGALVTIEPDGAVTVGETSPRAERGRDASPSPRPGTRPKRGP